MHQSLGEGPPPRVGRVELVRRAPEEPGVLIQQQRQELVQRPQHTDSGAEQTADEQVPADQRVAQAPLEEARCRVVSQRLAGSVTWNSIAASCSGALPIFSRNPSQRESE